MKKWFPRNVGLASGIMQGGIAYGTILFSEIATQYVNPHNYPPDVVASNSDKYECIRIFKD